MENITLDLSYIIKNYKKIDLIKDNNLLNYLIGKCIISICLYKNKNTNIDLFQIKKNDNLFLEISPYNKNEKYYSISFRKDYNINQVLPDSNKITKKYYIPSENWKLKKILISKDIDKEIFSYLGYYV